jgi:hypothetical protein
MTIQLPGVTDEQPVGEHPDVTIARAVSEIDDLRAEVASLTTERDGLYRLLELSNDVLAEVDRGYTELHAKLDAALAQRDSVNASLA